MKISFVIPAANRTGGIRVIAIYANLLTKMGHNVFVVTPGLKPLGLRKKLKSIITKNDDEFNRSFSTEFFIEENIDLHVLETYRPIVATDLPDADIVVATFWNTAEWISDLPNNKGKKVYFIQHHEVHPWLPINRVKATLRLPYDKIVVSRWLRDILSDLYDQPDVKIVPNGVDTSRFHADKRGKNTTPTIGFMYSTRPFKGNNLIIEAIELARRRIPELKVVAFGDSPATPDMPLPRNTTYFLTPSQSTIKNIYAKCDTWLFGSLTEGYGLPLLEAMACRTPVIGTPAGAAPELLDHNAGILVEHAHAERMAEAILRICRMNNTQWMLMSDKAYDIAGRHSWWTSAGLFANALQEFVTQSNI